jgi:hypothetical protein
LVLVAVGLVIAFKLYVSTRQKLDKANVNLEPANAVAGQPTGHYVQRERNQVKKEVGLWIDQREAVLVTITDQGDEMVRINSDIEIDAQFSGRSRSAGSQDAENIQDRKNTTNLGRYYDDIIGRIRNADSIWIIGPGEAKGELVKRLESKNLSQRIVGIETTDKLTDPQVSVKVRQYFPG